MDRNLLGDCGALMGWIGAFATHGISETHVAHHVASKIPHYHAWEASAAIKKKVAQYGLTLEGAPGGWREVYRVYKECKVRCVLVPGVYVFADSVCSSSRMRAMSSRRRRRPWMLIA